MLVGAIYNFIKYTIPNLKLNSLDTELKGKSAIASQPFSSSKVNNSPTASFFHRTSGSLFPLPTNFNPIFHYCQEHRN